MTQPRSTFRTSIVSDDIVPNVVSTRRIYIAALTAIEEATAKGTNPYVETPLLLAIAQRIGHSSRMTAAATSQISAKLLHRVGDVVHYMEETAGSLNLGGNAGGIIANALIAAYAEDQQTERQNKAWGSVSGNQDSAETKLLATGDELVGLLNTIARVEFALDGTDGAINAADSLFRTVSDGIAAHDNMFAALIANAGENALDEDAAQVIVARLSQESARFEDLPAAQRTPVEVVAARTTRRPAAVAAAPASA